MILTVTPIFLSSWKILDKTFQVFFFFLSQQTACHYFRPKDRVIFISSNLVRSDSLQPYGLQPFRILCPWDFPGKSTGVDCDFILQGIFSTQGSNLDLLHCRQILYLMSHEETLQSLQSMCIIDKFIHFTDYTLFRKHILQGFDSNHLLENTRKL